MISPSFDETSGAEPADADANQLAVAARETLASFRLVTELLAAVGSLAVLYGSGQSLAGFQALLKTYQTLLSTAHALSATGRRILALAQADPATD